MDSRSQQIGPHSRPLEVPSPLRGSFTPDSSLSGTDFFKDTVITRPHSRYPAERILRQRLSKLETEELIQQYQEAEKTITDIFRQPPIITTRLNISPAERHPLGLTPAGADLFEEMQLRQKVVREILKDRGVDLDQLEKQSVIKIFPHHSLSSKSFFEELKDGVRKTVADHEFTPEEFTLGFECLEYHWENMVSRSILQLMNLHNTHDKQIEYSNEAMTRMKEDPSVDDQEIEAYAEKDLETFYLNTVIEAVLWERNIKLPLDAAANWTDRDYHAQIIQDLADDFGFFVEEAQNEEG